MKNKCCLIPFLLLVVMSCSTKKKVAESQPATPAVVTQTTETLQFPAVEVAAEVYDGKLLYEDRCARCHQLYRPTDFSNEQWKPVLASMQANAQLNDVEIAAVYDYLVSENKQ